MLDKKGVDDIKCGSKVSNGRQVAGAIESLVKARRLSFERNRVVHESMLLPVVMYGSKEMVWSQNYRSEVQTVQMNYLRRVLGVRKIDKMRNEVIIELCRIKKRLNGKISESILRCLVMWKE